MHARGVPGAHVLLRVPAGREAADADVQFAADIAAFFSKARTEGKADVTCARPADISKPREKALLSSCLWLPHCLADMPRRCALQAAEAWPGSGQTGDCGSRQAPGERSGAARRRLLSLRQSSYACGIITCSSFLLSIHKQL